MAEGSVPEQLHTVLVVDDDDGIRRVLGQWVERLGYRMRSAGSADQAIEILSREEVAVALCDIRMPDRDGIWLADQIRARFPSVAIVLVTGLHEVDVAFTLRPGIVSYVTKPFEREAISGAIKQAMEWHISPSPLPSPPDDLVAAVNRWEGL
ncbi:MAG: response regulator [Vicinamibacterales bacterium]|nr:response regulator [Vicinamibacterales bacterium]